MILFRRCGVCFEETCAALMAKGSSIRDLRKNTCFPPQPLVRMWLTFPLSDVRI